MCRLLVCLLFLVLFFHFVESRFWTQSRVKFRKNTRKIQRYACDLSASHVCFEGNKLMCCKEEGTILYFDSENSTPSGQCSIPQRKGRVKTLKRWPGSFLSVLSHAFSLPSFCLHLSSVNFPSPRHRYWRASACLREDGLFIKPLKNPSGVASSGELERNRMWKMALKYACRNTYIPGEPRILSFTLLESVG